MTTQELLRQAKAAKPRLATLTSQEKNQALLAMAQRVLPREEHFRREQGYGGEMLTELAETLIDAYANR